MPRRERDRRVRSLAFSPAHGARTTPADTPRCLRCGFPVVVLPWGCKNPCRNCGFVYPLGDCSD